jgi:hypothetical protein
MHSGTRKVLSVMAPSVAMLPNNFHHNLLALNVYNLFLIMGCVTRTLKCVLYFSLLRKKLAYKTTVLPMCVFISDLLKQVHAFHSILMLTLCAGGHTTSLFLISSN